MFTEAIITEVINELKLAELKEVVVAEKASKVLNGMSFKESVLSFYVPDEREFYKLTAHSNANPVDNFGLENQHFSITTKYGNIHFYNRMVDIDTYCNWDSTLHVYYYHSHYLKRFEDKIEFH